MAIGRVPGATGIQPSIVDAKGDLIAATAADSVSRLAVGTNNQVLTADSAEATGLKYANEARATLTTTGDILYASAANTPARLGIGSTGNVLTVSGGVPAWAAPAGGGKVLQVISGSTTTETTIASTTLTDSTLSATITPSSATSKVLILISQSYSIMRDNVTAAGGVAILRGATNIYNASTQSFRIFTDPGITSLLMANLASVIHLDSPSTTSATTYKTQLKAQLTTNQGNIVAQPNSQPSTMILLEIGA